MLTEQYVSFETAKLLKEKGFHIPVYSHYTKVGSFWRCEDREDFNKETEIECYSRPTHQLAMRWLREVHDIHVWIKPLENGNCFSSHVLYNGIDKMVEGGAFGTYEEAVEAAIKYILEHLI